MQAGQQLPQPHLPLVRGIQHVRHVARLPQIGVQQLPLPQPPGRRCAAGCQVGPSSICTREPRLNTHFTSSTPCHASDVQIRPQHPAVTATMLALPTIQLVQLQAEFQEAKLVECVIGKGRGQVGTLMSGCASAKMFAMIRLATDAAPLARVRGQPLVLLLYRRPPNHWHMVE